ncbi:protein YgfX [Chitiniphilus eburneus]|uniref:Toxin CptA n=1 Tax=Chitiniphilus eburneus TaxID=2571148 RepID=A0A4U0PXK5_9NEIS|nr:protein YgfX [Chitiniphilus eburneus]TJZ73295.1 hypothetical protein FAZ21_10550 [Chitiniphilus eburneus]
MDCRFGPSRLGRIWTSGIHLLAGALAVTLPVWWIAPAWALVAASAYLGWRGLHGHGQLRAPGDGTLWLEHGGGEALIQPLPGTLVTTLLIVLRYRQAGGARSLVLWPDSAPAEPLRHLRIWLRWRPRPGE